MATETANVDKFIGSIQGKIFPERFVDLLFARSEGVSDLGGFGRVRPVKVIATCEYTHKQVALKTIPKDDIDRQVREEAIRRGRWEIEFLRAFSGHPFIVKFICACVSNEKLHIAMEWLDESLEDYAKKVDDKRVVAWKTFIGTTMAMLALNEKGIMHHDISPKNIMVHKGNVKIIDFGLSQVVRSTQSVLDGGTPKYKAPELTKGIGSKHIAMADIWSVGKVALSLLKGEAYLDRDFTSKWEDVKDEWKEGKAWFDLISKCLQYKPEERIGHIKLAEELINAKTCEELVGPENFKRDDVQATMQEVKRLMRDVYTSDVSVSTAKAAQGSHVVSQRLSMFQQKMKEVQDMVLKQNAVMRFPLDGPVGVVASLRAGEPWDFRKLVATKLSGNDIYSILPKLARSSDLSKARGFELSCGSSIEIRLDKYIKPVALKIESKSPNNQAFAFSIEFCRVDPSGKEKCLYSGALPVSATVLLKDDWKSGSVFRLSRTDQIEKVLATIMHLDFVVDGKDFFASEISRSHNVYRLPVCLKSSECDVNCLCDINSSHIIRALESDGDQRNTWVEIELLNHELHLQGVKLRPAATIGKFLIQGYRDNKWQTLFENEEDVQEAIHQVYEIENSLKSSRFRILKPGPDALELYYFDLFGELLRIN